MRVVPAYFLPALVSAAYAAPAPAPVAPARSFHDTGAEAYAPNLPSESRTSPVLRALTDPTVSTAAISRVIPKSVTIEFVEQYDHAEPGAPQGFKAGAPDCVSGLLKWIIEIWQPNIQCALTYVNSFYEVLSDGFAQPPARFEFYVSGFAGCFAKTAFVHDSKNSRKSTPPPPSCRVVVDRDKGKITVYQEDMKQGTLMLFSKELPEKLWRPGRPIY
ncbi:hypothetical protein GG344DRAFT_69382 [Lentinula edodes]|nr:hypothetical protein GG344DRAFT_69382 [Lentinula edodes]